jgi:hypothetical protein
MRICEFHDTDPLLCRAVTPDGLHCFALAPPHRDISRMPTCQRHRKQFIKANHCRALQRCGYPCYTPCEWIPLTEVNFCEKHRIYGPCYFLQLPLELRFEIYNHMFPCRFIPAEGSSVNTENVSRRNDPAAILRVNRQVYEEACVVLYRRT